MAERVRGLNQTGDLIVMSRLLVLQTKRLLLASSQKKLLDTDADHHRSEVARLKESAARAHEEYRRAVLDWASPETSQFSMVSYATMIDGLEELAGRLRKSSIELPTEDRIELDADLVRLDEIIGRWRASMLSSMGGTVA